ncbi:hypothetical protein RI054_04g20410 [Pseudoscourfieldia marina]
MDVSELPPTGPTASGQHLDAEIWTHSFSMGGMDPHVESIRLLVSPDDSDPASYLHELVLHQLSVATPPPLVASQASSASPLDDAALPDVPAEDPAPADDAATQEFIAEISRIFSEMREERRLRRGGGAGGPDRPRSYRTRASAHPLLRHTSWWEAQEGLCCLRKCQRSMAPWENK